MVISNSSNILIQQNMGQIAMGSPTVPIIILDKCISEFILIFSNNPRPTACTA